ncbi:hypothetical protein ACFL6I_28235 [candidate division KSB1 bacterium]
MKENITESSLNQNKLESLLSYLKIIQSQLPFLDNLSIDERKQLCRKGPNQHAFMRKVLELSKKNPQHENPYVNVKRMEENLNVADRLRALSQELNELSKSIEDTSGILYQESYDMGRMLYMHYQMIARNDHRDAQEIISELKPYFPRTGKKKK